MCAHELYSNSLKPAWDSTAFLHFFLLLHLSSFLPLQAHFSRSYAITHLASESNQSVKEAATKRSWVGAEDDGIK